MGRRTPGEVMHDAVNDYARPLGGTALATIALIGLWSHTTDPFLEPSVKFALEAISPWPMPWENDHNMRATQQQAGSLTLDTHLGSFANYTEARTSMTSEFRGQTISESHTLREGIVVSRIEIPGVPTVDFKADDDVMYLTRYNNGEDVGIPLDKVQFKMMNPETATLHDGELTCTYDIDDIRYTGCVEAASIRVGYFAGFPGFGEDQGGNLEIAGEQVFDQFAQIEACHFDQILIPAFNKIYEENGINKRIDGPYRYNEAMKTLIRYFLRENISDGTPPQRIFVKFSDSVNGGAIYTPTPSVQSRMLELQKQVDFPFELGGDVENSYCSTTSSGVIPITVPGEPDFEQVLVRIALGGLEQVPEGFDIQTGQYVPGSFKSAALDTSLGQVIKNILGNG